MKKKWAFIIGIVLVLVLGGIIIFLKFNSKEKNILVEELNYVDLSKTSTESERVDIIKSNVVKIINKLSDGTQIIGSGFFDKDGYLITNSHVVDIKGDITVIYTDGFESSAQIVSNDIASDVAILSVKDNKALALDFAETLGLKVTDSVYAIGYPLNLSGDATVTKGILSARRSVAGIEYLQTDASIDNGSSGGPLINTNGFVVGMNSLASSKSDINLALSSETIQNVLIKLKSDKNVTYINNERPTNAISNVLREVGYEEVDIYAEWDIINRLYHLHIGYNSDTEKDKTSKEDEGETSNQSTRVLDGDSSVSNITIDGYDIEFSPFSYTYKIQLKNGEDSIKINVTPNSSKATYKIVGNENFKLGANNISIIIVAENGSRTTYGIIAVKPIDELPGITGISCSMSSWDGINQYVSCRFVDSNGNQVTNSDYALHLIDTVKINAYVRIMDDESYDLTIGDKKLKYLNTYNFKAGVNQFEFKVPMDEISSKLTDSNYEVGGGAAEIVFVTTINTRKNGTFTDNGVSYSLNKR